MPSFGIACVDGVSDLEDPMNLTIRYTDGIGETHVQATVSVCQMNSGVLCFHLPRFIGATYINRIDQLQVTNNSAASVGSVTHYGSVMSPFRCGDDSSCQTSCTQQCSEIQQMTGIHECDGTRQKTEIMSYLIATDEEIEEHRRQLLSAKVTKIIEQPRYTCTELEYFLPAAGAKLTHIPGSLYAPSVCSASSIYFPAQSLQNTVVCTDKTSYRRANSMRGSYAGEEFEKALNYSAAEKVRQHWKSPYKNACDFFRYGCETCSQRCGDFLSKDTMGLVLCDGAERHVEDTFQDSTSFPLHLNVSKVSAFKGRICIVVESLEQKTPLTELSKNLRVDPMYVNFHFSSGGSAFGKLCSSRELPDVTICTRRQNRKDTVDFVKGTFLVRLRNNLRLTARLAFPMNDSTAEYDKECSRCRRCRLPAPPAVVTMPSRNEEFTTESLVYNQTLDSSPSSSDSISYTTEISNQTAITSPSRSDNLTTETGFSNVTFFNGTRELTTVTKPWNKTIHYQRTIKTRLSNATAVPLVQGSNELTIRTEVWNNFQTRHTEFLNQTRTDITNQTGITSSTNVLLSQISLLFSALTIYFIHIIYGLNYK